MTDTIQPKQATRVVWIPVLAGVEIEAEVDDDTAREIVRQMVRNGEPVELRLEEQRQRARRQ